MYVFWCYLRSALSAGGKAVRQTVERSVPWDCEEMLWARLGAEPHVTSQLMGDQPAAICDFV